MFWRISIGLLAVFSLACKGPSGPEAGTESQAVSGPEAYAVPEALVEASQLQSLLGKEHIVVVDFRKREDFDKGHIPGAIPMWRSDIEAAESPIPGMMASAPEMEALFSRLGIHPTDTLLVYDDQACCDAARLWWVLQVYGHGKVRLLNGGLHAWLEAGGALTADYAPRPASEFRFEGSGNPGLLIGMEELHQNLGTPGFIVVDSRSAEEYSGLRQKAGAAAAGRIPTSTNRDWAGATNYHGDKKFRSTEELKARFAFAGHRDSARVVAYCHSGVRSAHTSFVLTQLLGYPSVRNYDGSWLEWSATEGAPIEKDSVTKMFK